MQKQAGNLALQLPYGDCAFPMAGSCIVMNPAATKSTLHLIVASGSLGSGVP